MGEEIADALRLQFPDVDPSGNILVVDEFSWSEHTLWRAEDVLKEMYSHAKILGTLAMERPPFWQNNTALLGVTDPPNYNYPPLIAHYFSNPITDHTLLQKRNEFFERMNVLAPIIQKNISAETKGSRYIYTRSAPSPWGL